MLSSFLKLRKRCTTPRRAVALVAAAVLSSTLAFSPSVVSAQTTQQIIDNADWFERPLAEGVTWRYYFFDNLFNSYQNINIIEIDLDDPNVELSIPYRVPPPTPSFKQLHVLVGQNPGAGEGGLATPNAVAAVNGGRYRISTTGEPSAFLRSGGTTIIPEQGDASFWLQGAIGVLPNGKATVFGGYPSGVSNWADEQDHVDLLASGPVLLNNNTPGTSLPGGGNTGHCVRNPRTIQATTPDNRLLMITVDGRQDFAAGMTCFEMIEFVQALGADNAISLDGGGSTTMYVASEPGHNNTGVVNWFSDSGIRSVADGIAVSGAPTSPLAWDGRGLSLDAPTLPRSGDPVVITAEIENIGTETWTTSNVSVVPSRPFGRTSDFIPSGQESTFFEMVPSTVSPGQTATFTLNLVAPQVSSDTVMTEHFALESTATGFFGPPDNFIRFSSTVRPEVVGAPPLFIVQGGAAGPNNQWYDEPVGNWSNSVVTFTATGVANPGTQRFVFVSGGTNRTARFRPVFQATGTYRMDIAFPGSTNNIRDVLYTVNHMDGTFTQTIDQHPSSGESPNTWITLGEFDFSDGESGDFGVHSITVTNPNPTPPMQGDRFYSGAVRFDFISFVNSVDEWMLY